MDADKLRSTYNNYFLQAQNSWSSTNLRKTSKVARKTLRWLNDLGYHNTSRSKLLDVGCATGYYTESFRLLGYEAIGLDYSEVAVDQARIKFPNCRFVQMNGFEPEFQETFDVIFCRGFSGANTHNLEFIVAWVNKYMKYLSPTGFFVLAYSSDFSGTEKEGETVNHSREELDKLIKLINGRHAGTFLFHYFGILSRVKKRLQNVLFRKRIKEYYYIFIRKN